MLTATLKKNDRKANFLILTFSAIVFAAVIILSRFQLKVDLGFDVHLFAMANAVINSAVALLLVIALVAVKQKSFKLHRGLMLTAMVLSILFLVSYICHHLFAGDTRFGDLDHNGILSDEEKTAAGSARTIYYFLLATHIPLAGIVLPFILYSAYHAMTGDYYRHKRLVKYTWPVWFYVAVTGVVVYLMIKQYY